MHSVSDVDSDIHPQALPSIMLDPKSTDDNCGDANKLADGTAHNDTPFFLETSLPVLIGEITSEQTLPGSQIQTLLDIQMDPM